MSDYETNPLNSNVFFSLGQPIMVILLVFTGIFGLLLLISRIAKLGNLEFAINHWVERFLLITFYTGLIWLGLSMLITYISYNAMDAINGAVLVLGSITSIVYRATGNKDKSAYTLTAMFIFLGVVLLWTFIATSVLNGLPSTVRDSVANNIRPTFFQDLFKYWHWMQ